MRFLFWFLFFGMPIAAVIFVGAMVVRLWRRGMGLAHEVGDVAAAAGGAFDADAKRNDMRARGA